MRVSIRHLSEHPDGCLVVLENIAGQKRQRVVPIKPSRILDWYCDEDSPLVQNAFPSLSSDDREFLLTGLTPEDWDELTSEY